MSSVQLEGCQGHGYPFGEFESAADCIMPGNQDEPDAAPALMHNEPTESADSLAALVCGRIGTETRIGG